MKRLDKRKGVLVMLAVLGIAVLILPMDLSAQGAPKGKVVVAVRSLGGERLDYSQPSGNTNVVLALVLNRNLIERGYDGEYIPGTAQSWKMSPDGKTWDLFLRKGVKWHNGDIFTAQDVVFGIERMKRPEIAAANFWGPAPLLDNLARIEVVDDYHVKYHFKTPFPLFLYWVTAAPPMPKKYIEKVGDKVFSNEKPVGTGPFKFVSKLKGSHYEFEAFEQFSGRIPSFKTLVIRIIPENSTTIAALKTGEIDIASDIQGNLLEEVRNTPGLHLTTAQGQGGGSSWIVFAQRYEKNSPWADVRVRKAVALAIDRQKICDTTFRGQATPAVFPDAPSAFGIPKDLKPWPYDPEKAKALLAEAGYPNGLPGEWDMQTAASGSSPFQPETTEAVAGYLSKVGIKTRFQVMEMGGFGAAYRAEKLKGLPVTGTTAMFDVGLKTAVWAARGGAWSWMKDEDTNILWDKQLITPDPEERRKILEKAVEILINDVRIVPLVESKTILGLGPRIKEYKLKKGSAWATDGINNIVMAK